MHLEKDLIQPLNALDWLALEGSQGVQGRDGSLLLSRPDLPVLSKVLVFSHGTASSQDAD
jgi:hypothetical protein